MIRVVFDTNVIISAMLFIDSAPGRAILASLEYGTILMSQSLAEELSQVLDRDKFDRYLPRERRERFLTSLIRATDLINVNASIHACRDPKDNRILELAVDGDADFIVTGDADLLVLRSLWDIPIVTPTGLLRIIHDDPGGLRESPTDG